MNDTGPDSTDLDAYLGLRRPTRRRRWRRRALAIAALLLLAAVLAWLFAAHPAPVRYATAEVERGDMQVTVTATGNLEPTNEVTVGSELSGLVKQVMVDVNDTVAARQPLAVLDTQRLEDAIRRSRAALAQANADVAQAEATVAETQATLARLEGIFARSHGGLPSQAELDAARAAYRRARAGVDSARAAVASADAQLSSDRTNLDKATIRSPVDGVVLARNVEPGQTVAASFSAPELFVLAEDLSSMRAKVKVDEADVGQVRAGQPATFTVDAWPGRVFAADVLRVDYGANTTTQATGGAASSVVSYTTVLAVDNPDGLLRPGMTATATLVTSQEDDVLLVPNAALRYTPSAAPGRDARPGGFISFPRRPRGSEGQREVGVGRGATQTVHVLDADGRPQPVTITVGASDGNRTIVTGGALEAGQQVVTGELAAGR